MSKNGLLKRITVKVTEDFHKEIKIRAISRNVTISRYILKALWEQIRREEIYEKKE
jgi:hypothetical protein